MDKFYYLAKGVVLAGAVLLWLCHHR